MEWNLFIAVNSAELFMAWVRNFVLVFLITVAWLALIN